MDFYCKSNSKVIEKEEGASREDSDGFLLKIEFKRNRKGGGPQREF